MRRHVIRFAHKGCLILCIRESEYQVYILLGVKEVKDVFRRQSIKRSAARVSLCLWNVIFWRIIRETSLKSENGVRERLADALWECVWGKQIRISGRG